MQLLNENTCNGHREGATKAPFMIARQDIEYCSYVERTKKNNVTLNSHHLKMVVKVIRLGALMKPSPTCFIETMNNCRIERKIENSVGND